VKERPRNILVSRVSNHKADTTLRPTALLSAGPGEKAST
jgi:hypothetical protein